MHIGNHIRETLARERRTAAWLAAQIFVSRTHIYKIFEKESIDCSLLARISRALGHDFFIDLSEELKK